MKLKFLFLLLSFPCLGFSQVEFIWVDSLEDDFSFSEKWAYEDGIELNQWGQLSCDGLCPQEVDVLKDAQGRIYDDSLVKFYTLVDTTHRYFTHEGTARVYEFGECHYANAHIKDEKMYISTEANISTHSTLHLEFDNNNEPIPRQKAYIVVNSIRSSVGPIDFAATRGKIEISRAAYAHGFIQMRFDLEFTHLSTDSQGAQTWKGKILTEIEK